MLVVSSIKNVAEASRPYFTVDDTLELTSVGFFLLRWTISVHGLLAIVIPCFAVCGLLPSEDRTGRALGFKAEDGRRGDVDLPPDTPPVVPPTA